MTASQNDILLELETQNEPFSRISEIQESPIILETFPFVSEEKQSFSPLKRIAQFAIFGIKYLFTSSLIFGVLLLTSNYSAYWKIASTVIFAKDLENTKQSLIESVAATQIHENEKNAGEKNTQAQFAEHSEQSTHSLTQFIAQTNANDVELDIEITPYENRIVIPKIGKNIPLLDITQTHVSGTEELNDIFMKELENGVIRYPGSAKPGEIGNTFIFGHSSNFPWIKGAYNDVFALLDKVEFDDEIIVYYGQEKYIYKITAKNIIKPGDVSVLQKEVHDISEISLMTCWPIGTTLNRLILTGELVKIEK